MNDKRFEEYPLTRAEYISAMVHLYRGEQYRAQVWRTRLDTTTNWAVLSMGALLSIAFTGNQRSSHLVLVIGMAIVFTMLMFEARRFRFYDVWRARVRRIEENFYVPILRRDLSSPMENWGFVVAEDLLVPRYKIGLLMALKARLMNNYLAIFFVLLASWIIKARMEITDGEGFYSAISNEGMPGWFVLFMVGGFYGFLSWVVVFGKRQENPESIYFGAKLGDSIDDVG